WRTRDGFFKGAITAIAQTPDGYLWLGTLFGVLRFDGVEARPWQPPAGSSLPSNWIQSMLVARDGTLFIGTLKGLASWKAGELTRYPRLDGASIDTLTEDGQGTVWAGGYQVPNGVICAVDGRTGKRKGGDQAGGWG